MIPDVLADARVRSVPWRDLVPLSWWQVVRELALPLPWLAGSLALAHHGHWCLALPLSFVFFLAGLRQVHNAYHHALGLPRPATEGVMFAWSVLMLGSMHAVRHNHLRHHRHCLDDDDVEGRCARMPGWQALLTGPTFPLRMHIHAWTHGGRRLRAWMTAELAATVLLVGAACAWREGTALGYHVLAMALGQCLAGFFAVWTVHRDCDPAHVIARTSRARLLNWATFNMFFHVEHHLFPRVPTCRLPELARRLDAAAPEFRRARVIG